MSGNSSFDWRVVFFAAMACFLVPWFLLSTISAFVYRPSFEGAPVRVEGFGLWWMWIYIVAIVVGMPLAAGYFTATYAKNRPQLHVLAVAAVGFVLFTLTHSYGFGTRVLQAALWIAMTSLGAFFVLRRPRHEP